MVVLGAEEWRLMTKRTLHRVGKVNGFPPSCSSFTEQGWRGIGPCRKKESRDQDRPFIDRTRRFSI